MPVKDRAHTIATATVALLAALVIALLIASAVQV